VNYACVNSVDRATDSIANTPHSERPEHALHPRVPLYALPKLLHARLQPCKLDLRARRRAVHLHITIPIGALLRPLPEHLLHEGDTLAHRLLGERIRRGPRARAKVLELVRALARETDYAFGEVRELGDVDPEALVAHARRHLVQERDVACALARDVRDDMCVAHVRDRLRERGELVEVRCEEAQCVDLRRDVLGDGPGQAEAVVGGGA
jgi:hypothetical protein